MLRAIDGYDFEHKVDRRDFVLRGGLNIITQ